MERRTAGESGNIVTFDGTGKKNCYWCAKCRRYTVTIDREKGTTPFSIRCRATPNCNALADSQCYPPEPWPKDHPDLVAPPRWEWIKPEGDALAELSASMREHVDRGGLVLRALPLPATPMPLVDFSS